tara:strand:+ start:348 stop:680 length:333 start_codon:yes stop_codon:yes gene_type:complete
MKGIVMGRAIDMENDISSLKIKVEKLENTLRGMVSKLDSLDEKASKTMKVNLTEDVGAIDSEEIGSTMTGGAKTYKIEEKDEKEKTNNEGNGKGSKQSNSRSKKSSSKNK